MYHNKYTAGMCAASTLRQRLALHELFENLCLLINFGRFSSSGWRRSHMQNKQSTQHLKFRKCSQRMNFSEGRDTATLQPARHMNVLNVLSVLVPASRFGLGDSAALDESRPAIRALALAFRHDLFDKLHERHLSDYCNVLDA